MLGGGSLPAPELGLVVDPSGPLGAVTGRSRVSVLGVDAAGPPPLSDVGPLEEGLSSVDDDDPESLGSSSDAEDAPESLEPPSNPTPRPATNAARTTRCGDPNVATPGTPLRGWRLQSGAVTYLRWRCQRSVGVPTPDVADRPSGAHDIPPPYRRSVLTRMAERILTRRFDLGPANARYRVRRPEAK